MTLYINPGVSIGPGNTLKGATRPPTGLHISDPGISAYQIKQDYPTSTDGLYWIKNPSINDGTPIQIYADMTTNGGGWTLILQNSYYDWTKGANDLYRNQKIPPRSLVAEGTFVADHNYSILGWADYIKRSASGFQYMIEAYARGRNGGIWTANQPYSFVGQVDLEAYDTQGSAYFGNDPVSGSDGFRQDITLDVKFPYGSSTDNGTWEYDNSGIEKRMPWYAGNLTVGDAIITTTHDDGGGWWGTMMSEGTGFLPTPWIQFGGTGATVDVSNPAVLWYWVR